MNTALYTGSFDPITKGHLDIIQTASKMFDHVIVGVGTNPTKKHTFDITQRLSLINANIKQPNVVVVEIPAGKLTADYAYEHKATILKGVRMNAADFDYEWLMADINRAHVHGLKTVILPASPEFNNISSSAAKELTKLHGKVEDFVPLNVKAALEKEFVKQRRVIITGTIGSGKSAVTAELVRQRPGEVHNIDLDVIAHEILFDRPEPIYQGLRSYLHTQLKPEVWTRKALGQVVFKSKAARELLNEAIRQPLITRVRSALYGKTGTVIFNGALIIEAGWMHLANNNVILLDVDKYFQTLRLKARKYTAAQIKSRVSAQFNSKAKLHAIMNQISKDNYGSYECIDTSGVSLDHTVEHADAFIRHLHLK